MNEKRGSTKAHGVMAALAMLLAVVAVYCPWRVLSGDEVLSGADHIVIHERRMQFARDELLGPRGELPHWYPREFLGAPFRANLQSFPLIPTRLAAFFLCSPRAAMTLSVVASAALAALFTYLLCRRFERSPLASAAAGFTFACSGYFAARILVGHTPLLEAYPAAPVLLYLVDRACRPLNAARARWLDLDLLALAAAALCFALVGHPQLSVYAFGLAAVFACARAANLRRAASVLVAFALGVGLAAFALSPMASLMKRSTRILDLAPSANDLALPYSRLLAFIAPWSDGWPSMVVRSPARAFAGYPNDAYFWDTVSYVGLAPLVAVALLALLVARRKQRITPLGMFFTLAGVVALSCALPWWREVTSLIPGTFLRSPARLLYLVALALALALAVALDRVRAWSPPRARWLGVALAATLAAAHGLDLAAHARCFVLTMPRQADPPSAKLVARVGELVGDGRLGMDYSLLRPINRRFDDAGVFDSLLLARPYRFMLATSGAPADTNEQLIDAARFALRTLQAAGVRLLWTRVERPDLERIQSPLGGEWWYPIPAAQPRARLYAPSAVRFMSLESLHERLRDPAAPLADELWFDESCRSALEVASTPAALGAMQAHYERVNSDEIVVRTRAAAPSVLRVLESFDPGWRATVDGRAVAAAPAHDTFLACAVPAGEHEVRWVYRTPGVGLGVALSVASLVALLLLARNSR